MLLEHFFCKNISEVYVVFVDNTSLWWLRLLKKGFRHCYLVLKIAESGIWMEINPMSNQIILNIYEYLPDFDYISYLSHEKNLKICPMKIKPAPLKSAPICLFTCVEMVKRFLGIHEHFIHTPHQLYTFLQVVGKKS